ncbi:hypothetical protein E2C01_071169 [Portunus trituberculatus]|uniref:Uncharacterized protein n=1 Tax=Portunus trituberculatus TaxID=210409 RepID=A0A5B7HUN6_PORTR|nr:hypothetical protein [Portunus trituberculatus]
MMHGSRATPPAIMGARMAVRDGLGDTAFQLLWCMVGGWWRAVYGGWWPAYGVHQLGGWAFMVHHALDGARYQAALRVQGWC